jgi:chromosome segregation ATPase
MITLEQIRLLESKITRAIELIRVLKDENGTLRRGLESAQKRMKELESLVDGFKADQREIESVIVRTLHTLDELEDGATRRAEHSATPRSDSPQKPDAHPEPRPQRRAAAESVPPQEPPVAQAPPALPGPEPRAAKEELDIF